MHDGEMEAEPITCISRPSGTGPMPHMCRPPEARPLDGGKEMGPDTCWNYALKPFRWNPLMAQKGISMRD